MNNGKPKVLAVDDEPGTFYVLGNALGDSFDLVVAKSGEEAIARACGDPQPDLIILDVVMKGLDGYATLRALKNNPRTKSIPVIFLTARASDDDEHKGFEMGAVDYIYKPLRPTIVKARVKTHIDLKRKTDRLEELTRHDDLTGILNKRGFWELLKRDWAHAERNTKWISLAIFDIDRFKDYNDAFGHVAGDLCLVKVAEAIKSAFGRPYDAAARFGGEEFILLLPDVDADGAKSIAENARDAVAKLSINAPESAPKPYVTISGGTASTCPSPKSDMTRLVEAADRQLYRAKDDGRDRVYSVTFDPEPAD